MRYQVLRMKRIAALDSRIQTRLVVFCGVKPQAPCMEVADLTNALNLSGLHIKAAPCPLYHHTITSISGAAPAAHDCKCPRRYPARPSPRVDLAVQDTTAPVMEIWQNYLAPVDHRVSLTTISESLHMSTSDLRSDIRAFRKNSEFFSVSNRRFPSSPHSILQV